MPATYARALVQAADRPGLRLNLDLYHAQIGEGNLIQLLQRAALLISEIQVTDVPGRREPGPGEISHPGLAAALRKIGYTGVIDFEARTSVDSDDALQKFRVAFSS